MGKIFCLMGKSNSGKDTMFRRLIHQPELSLKPVVLYTTRPIRKYELNGREYFFVSPARIRDFERQGRVIERRDYRTTRGIWTYCTIDDGQIKSDDSCYLMITTLEAYRKLQAYFGVGNVVPLYLHVDDEIRLERAMRREKQQQRPNYDEMCRRFLADNRDFSYYKLKEAGIRYFYKNHHLMNCLHQLIQAVKAAKRAGDSYGR